MKLEEIQNPSFLKQLKTSQFNSLIKSIKEKILLDDDLDAESKKKFIQNVELVTALETVFNENSDDILFSDSQQEYVRKILVGNLPVNNYPNNLSLALGLANSQDLNPDDSIVINIDNNDLYNYDAISSLNLLGKSKYKIILVFIDHNLENMIHLSKNTLTKFRSSNSYLEFKDNLNTSLGNSNSGKVILNNMRSFKDTVKKGILSSSIFTEMGWDYLGPIKAEEFNDLKKAFIMAKKNPGSLVIHVVINKLPAKNNKHLIQINENQPDDNIHSLYDWQEIVDQELFSLGKDNESLLVLSPKDKSVKTLNEFNDNFPQRSFVNKMNLNQTLNFALGIAIKGFHPYINVSGSQIAKVYQFLKEQFCYRDLPVIIGINNPGISDNLPSQQAIDDLSIFNLLPNVVIATPNNPQELKDLIKSAVGYPHPFIIRIPIGETIEVVSKSSDIKIGTWELVSTSVKHNYLITYGPDAVKFTNKALNNKLPINIINARFNKPLDEDMLLKIAYKDSKIYIYQPALIAGGLGSMIAQFYHRHDLCPSIKIYGIDTHYLSSDTIVDNRKKEKLDTNSIFTCIEADLMK